jgi:hypothetical protein
MVVRNKFYSILDKYRSFIKKKVEKGFYRGQTRKGLKKKNKILDFYLSNNRWPKRNGATDTERTLATAFENYLSKESGTYDAKLRRIVMATGRKSNHKRKHDIAGYKKEIIAFMKEHGRVPSTSYKYQTFEGEARLRHKLDFYTVEKNDMTFLGVVYGYDKCHKSGIPAKYRALINKSLDVEKPLVRLV